MWIVVFLFFLVALQLSIVAAKTEGKVSLLCTFLMIVSVLFGGYTVKWILDNELIEIDNSRE